MLKQLTPIVNELTIKEIKTRRYDEITPMVISANGVIYQNNFASSPSSLEKSILKFSKGTRSPMEAEN